MIQNAPGTERILIIDDDLDIWKAYCMALNPAMYEPGSATARLNQILGSADSPAGVAEFALDFASQGQEGYQMAAEAKEENPFALAFVDIRMPPGWDGMETAARIHRLDPNIEIVIVSAYSDRSIEEIVQAVGSPDKLLFLRKPFDPDELKQIARSLTSKWRLARTEEHQRIARQRVEEQLQQAQKMESIGTLAGGIAHDFNNILSAIMGYTDLALLRAKGRDSDLEGDLLQVRKAAERATDLVRQILTFSRRQSKERLPLHIFLVVKEALKLLRASIPTTIDIRQDIDSQATVMADPTQIHQLVMNLCTNGYQAMADQGGTLTVSLHDTTFTEEQEFPMYLPLPAGPYVVLTVSDTGSGIDPAAINKIFDPYFTTKEKGKGTGMGLAVVKGIVDAHQGAITVNSTPGKGSSFTVYLPISDATLAYTERHEERVTPPTSSKHERIMVVDDESSLRDLAHQFLSTAGYRVELYTNAVDAWQAFAKSPHAWHLLLTDQTMPGMTGRELAAKVLGLRPDLPVLLCSGYSHALSNMKQENLGIATYLQKPFDRDTLLHAVANALAREASPPAAH